MNDTQQSFFQLVYVSSATQPFSVSELAILLEYSRQKNARAEISGMLLYHDGNFMQLLEGAEQPVRATYARIEQDPRHRGCLILIGGQVAARTFPAWSMGFRDFASAEVKAMPGYSGFLTKGSRQQFFPGDPSQAMTLLTTFREKLR